MLFGIMLTKHNDRTKSTANNRRHFFVAAGVIIFFGIMFYGIRNLSFGNHPETLQENNTRQIGLHLYSHDMIPFEITSLLLLVALVGAIIMARRDDEEEEANGDE
jgi:NADH-quinone oxidoreductase subunit J